MGWANFVFQNLFKFSQHENFSGVTVNMFFFFYIYNLHFFKQKIYSDQVLMYLNVPPVRKPLQNTQIDS